MISRFVHIPTLLLGFFFLTFVTFTAPALAVTLSGAGGLTGDDDAVIRLSVISEWDSRWYETRVGSLTGYWDAGYTYWDSGSDYSAAHSLSFSPVLVYEFNNTRRFTPFIEAGIGAALFSKTRVGKQRLGSAFNFENRIGFGLEFPHQHRIGIRMIHYSNAGIKQPNDGLDAYTLFYSKAF